MATIQHPQHERRTMPERVCSVCLAGVYVTRIDSYAAGAPGVPERTGGESDRMWHVEACSHCGHVQVFRRDWRERRA